MLVHHGQKRRKSILKFLELGLKRLRRNIFSRGLFSEIANDPLAYLRLGGMSGGS
jgi:hypothetical protein